MDIKTFPLGELQANCYLLTQNGSCILIDPADSADFLLEELQRKNLNLVGMIATHGHFDHVMAAGEIQLSYPDIPLYINSEDSFLLKRLGETARYFLGYEPYIIPIQQTEHLSVGDLKIEDFKFQIIHTPGHTPGSSCLYLKEEGIIFTGDTLFSNAIGRYDFKYSDKEKLKESLNTILELPEETIVYPGHGESTLIQIERLNREYFFNSFSSRD